MPKLQSYKRINHNDYPEEQQDLIRQLSVSLNIGIESIYDALSQKLSIEDNLDSCVPQFNVTVDSNGSPVEETSFQIHKTQNVNGLQVLRAENIDNPNNFPTSGIHISWTQDADRIIVNHIAGLPANEEFSIKLVVFG